LRSSNKITGSGPIPPQYSSSGGSMVKNYRDSLEQKNYGYGAPK